MAHINGRESRTLFMGYENGMRQHKFCHTAAYSGASKSIIYESKMFTYRIIIKMQWFHTNTNFVRNSIEIRSVDEIYIIVRITDEQNIAGR